MPHTVQYANTLQTQAYILPALDRPNLKVLTEAYVCHIVMQEVPSGIAAQSVEFDYGGSTHKVLSGREVILCAGYVEPLILDTCTCGQVITRPQRHKDAPATRAERNR